MSDNDLGLAPTAQLFCQLRDVGDVSDRDGVVQAAGNRPALDRVNNSGVSGPPMVGSHEPHTELREGREQRLEPDGFRQKVDTTPQRMPPVSCPPSLVPIPRPECPPSPDPRGADEWLRAHRGRASEHPGHDVGALHRGEAYRLMPASRGNHTEPSGNALQICSGIVSMTNRRRDSSVPARARGG
jgi:hypothetical protein